MRKLKHLIAGIILLLSATGCYVQKPTGYVSEPDYNKRVTVAQAGMVKRSTPIGITFKIGIIGAGAYGGYASQLIKFQTGNEQKPVDWANAALGAMAGVGVNTLIDLISGKGKEKPAPRGRLFSGRKISAPRRRSSRTPQSLPAGPGRAR